MIRKELRKDPVSGDWIVIAPGRAKRPHEHILKKPKRKASAVKGCPFENPGVNGHLPVLSYPNNERWRVQIIQNKYPAFTHEGGEVTREQHGPFSVLPAVGYHDVVVTRDHKNNFAHLPKGEANQLFQAFRDRYLMFSEHKSIEYALMFQNWGPTAGASIYHPHYQMIAIPVIPPDVDHSLEGSSRFYEKHKQCVHCAMIDWERKEKKRIIYENKEVVAFAPFVSRSPFEIRIFPKKHLPYFEDSDSRIFDSAVETLQKSLHSIEKKLNDPDYNFFIHTAPIRNKNDFQHYHWHIEILPKVTLRAGFELGTGVEINVVDPDEAAKLLRVR